MMFTDRHQAGVNLASWLPAFEAPLVVALPRGGVPVAIAVARRFATMTHTCAVERVTCSTSDGLTLAAVAHLGATSFHCEALAVLGISRTGLAEAAEEARRRARLRELSLQGFSLPRVRSTTSTVLLVDDGVATGLSAVTAIRALRSRGFDRVVVATPVASRYGVDTLAAEGAACIAMRVIERSRFSVGDYYEDFSEVSEEKLAPMLTQIARAPP